MLWSVTGDSTCRMNQRKTPCDPHAALQAAVDRGIREGAQFLEIYPSDIKNAALRDVIDAAHARLTQ
jgi:hypothetical protein